MKNFTSVKSTAIDSYLAEDAKGGTVNLTVKLKSGNTYMYKGVDASTLNGFIKATSKGNFYSTKIVPHYEAVKV